MGSSHVQLVRKNNVVCLIPSVIHVHMYMYAVFSTKAAEWGGLPPKMLRRPPYTTTITLGRQRCHSLADTHLQCKHVQCIYIVP